MGGNDLGNFVGHAAQIAIDHVALDVEDRSYVVVADGGLFRTTDEVGHVAENLDGGDAGCGRGRSAGVHRGEVGGADRDVGIADDAVCSAGRGDGDILQIDERLHVILRSLCRDVVTHTSSGIEPKGRGGLKAATGRGQQAAGNIALGQADVLSLGTIHVDEEGRIVERLLDVQIRRARNVAYFLQ